MFRPIGGTHHQSSSPGHQGQCAWNQTSVSSGWEITVYLIAALIAGIAAANIARAKRRYAGFWTALCFLLPPAILILLLLPAARTTEAPAKANNGDDSDSLDDF
jgi:hypothetical protein